MIVVFAPRGATATICGARARAATNSIHDPISQIPAMRSETEKPLTDAAKRALAEAEARRVAQRRREDELNQARELDGRKGPDPVRYGDWESKGLASDF